MRHSFLFLLFISMGASGHTLEVPAVRQSNEYACGAAVMVAALGYYGGDFNESELSRRMGTNATYGTAISEMVKVAKAEGLSARVGTGVTVAELSAHLEKKQLAIVAAQAWSANPATADYPGNWNDGHYMVVVGIDQNTIYFMDPATLGGRASLPLKEFVEERWHDVSDGKRLHQPTIFLEGKPKPAPLWSRVE